LLLGCPIFGLLMTLLFFMRKVGWTYKPLKLCCCYLKQCRAWRLIFIKVYWLEWMFVTFG
jgi:hypothetical protein